MKKILLNLLVFSFFPIALILRLLGFRFFKISNPAAIGHLCFEPFLYLKLRQLKQEKNYKMVLVLPTSQICGLIPAKAIVKNKVVLNYWRKYFFVIASSWMYLLLLPLIYSPLLKYQNIHLHDSGSHFSIFANVENSTQPIFHLQPDHLIKGKKILQSWGIQENDWYVTVHCREIGYKQDQICRNSKIETLELALKEIQKQGGWCIRIGRNLSPLPPQLKNHKKFIDYSYSEFLSDWMDIFLVATSRFYLGSSSTGINEIASLFSVPCVLVNVFTFCCLPYNKYLFIPKLYFSREKNRLLSFSEILQQGRLGLLAEKYELDNEGINVIDNSPEEICDAIKEMITIINHKNTVNDQVEILRKKFRNQFHPQHHGYGSQAIIGSEFIKKYEYLL